LASQARRLAALLAWRQPGSEQYFWCFAFRASARKNAPQNRQLWSSGRTIADPPCAEKCGATARCHAHYEQICQERKREGRRRKSVEEDPKKTSVGIRQRKSTKKNHHFQTAKFR
jgi:hypothetical protein